ncbi:hypothetical protein Tco_1485962 [Tanacetum coccineum]
MESGRDNNNKKKDGRKTNSISSVKSIGSKGGKDDGLGSFPSLSEAFGGQTPTSLAANIHDFESQMLEEKLVLVGDDGKPLKPSHNASNINDIGDLLNVDINKTQCIFHVLTTSASSECKVVIPRSSVEEDSMVIAILNLENEGYMYEIITIEYEWTPHDVPIARSLDMTQNIALK